ncbi:MAG: hypothetical protein R3D44_03985 [Hyphomicrobiaceae bacterium]
MTNIPAAGTEPSSSARETAVETVDLETAAAALAPSESPPEDALDPVELVRQRLEIEDGVPDVTIAASLAQIASQAESRDRWLTAFGSPLGKHLARRGSDLNAALDLLLALVPRPQG